MRTLPFLALFLCHACSETAMDGARADGSGAGTTGSVSTSNGAGVGGALSGAGGGPSGVGGGASGGSGGADAAGDAGAKNGGPDGAKPADSGIPSDVPSVVPPSRRDGSIPMPPPYEPPCAPDSNAGNGRVCPYQVIVGCRLLTDAGVQTCICLGPNLGGKWGCEEARDGGIGIAL
jgi:hypothetical protein